MCAYSDRRRLAPVKIKAPLREAHGGWRLKISLSLGFPQRRTSEGTGTHNTWDSALGLHIDSVCLQEGECQECDTLGYSRFQIPVYHLRTGAILIRYRQTALHLSSTIVVGKCVQLMLVGDNPCCADFAAHRRVWDFCTSSPSVVPKSTRRFHICSVTGGPPKPGPRTLVGDPCATSNGRLRYSKG